MPSPPVPTHGRGRPDPGASPLLRRALVANAVFSGASALALLAAPHAIGGILGSVPPAWLRWVGAGLALFAVDLWHQTRQRPLNRLRAAGATLGDLGWVVASVAILVGRPDVLSPAGSVVVGGVAAAVAALATAQILGARRSGLPRSLVTE